MATENSSKQNILWNNAPIADAETWAREMERLLNLERFEEKKELDLLKTTLSPKEAELAGISLPFLRVLEKTTALFGRSCIKLGKGEIPLPSYHRFRVGSEVIIISSKIKLSVGGFLNLRGVVSKISTCFIDVIVNNNDGRAGDESFELLHESAVVRLDQLSNEATHRKMCEGLKRMLKYDTHNKNENILKKDQEVSALREVLLGQRLPSPNRETLDQYGVFNDGLDESQREAVQFALTTNDIALIHGPPGTGKTTTIVEFLLQAVLKKKQKVLLVAPSNVAVDNVLERLVAAAPFAEQQLYDKSSRVKPIRLGHPARQSQGVLAHSLDALLARTDGMEVVSGARVELKKLQQNFKKKHSSYEHKNMQREVKELRKDIGTREKKAFTELLDNCNVVCCTCIGAAAASLAKLDVFDVCVIDEAAMALEVACWLPILRARRLVLAGDHKQLPPTIKSDAAAAGGLSRTLFERIIELYGDKVSRMLSVQYRMNVLISNWASQVMYDGKLSAAEEVSKHSLADLPHVNIDLVEDSSPMLFFDTAGCDMYEDCDDAEEYGQGSASAAKDSHTSKLAGLTVMSRSNRKEAALVVKYAVSLMTAGLKPDDVAIITPYNGQVDVIKGLFLDKEVDAENETKMPYSNIEVRSVDGFQGGEREVVILSLVRSNARNEIGFVSDKRRLNVAVTRAKRHCVVFGDSDTFSRTPSVAGLMTYIADNGSCCCALDLVDFQALPSVPTTTASTNSPKMEENVQVEVQVEATPNEKELIAEVCQSIEFEEKNDMTALEEVEKEAEDAIQEQNILLNFLSDVADLSEGSDYMAHRPRSEVIEVKVRLKNRIATVRASIEEDVGSFRKRVAAVFHLEVFYCEQQENQCLKDKFKLVYKGVLEDGVKLKNTKVRANSTVMLVVSGVLTVQPETKPMPTVERVAALKQQIFDFNNGHSPQLCFSSDLSNAERAIVHGMCEEVQLRHVSSGEGNNRFITVSRVQPTDEKLTPQPSSSSSSSSSIPALNDRSSSASSKVDLKALHAERLARAKIKQQTVTTPPERKDKDNSVTPLVDNEWTSSPAIKPVSKSKKKKSKNIKNSKNNGELSSQTLPEEDDDMLLLDELIQTQKQAQEVKKEDPGYGWKRWVTADGILQSNGGPSESERRAQEVLKQTMKSKINAKCSERSVKSKDKKKK